MILLDTHIWVWWVHGDPRLSTAAAALIRENESSGIGVSIISCWEVAKLRQVGRLVLPVGIAEWFTTALGYPGVQLIPLSTAVVADACNLPGEFHKDPADQIIVATARVLGCPLVTADDRILKYVGVRGVPKSAT